MLLANYVDSLFVITTTCNYSSNYKYMILQLQESIAGIIAAENVCKKEAILAWDGEKRPISKYYYSHTHTISHTHYIPDILHH